MLKYRLPSGLTMAALILGSIFIDGAPGRYLFLIFGIFLAYAAVVEYLKMVEKLSLQVIPAVTAFFAAVVLFFSVMELKPGFYFVLLAGLALLGWIHLLLASDKRGAMVKNITSASAFIFLVFPLFTLALIYNLKGGSVSGRLYFLFLLLVTKMGDTGAYTVGTISSKIIPGGNHKILPRISPKKSWEGTLGGMCISIGSSYLFCHFVPGMQKEYGILFPLVAGFILFWGGFLGDLVESALKRTAGVKDSGNMIPGMGGALDVIDSLLLNAPIFYIFLSAHDLF